MSFSLSLLAQESHTPNGKSMADYIDGFTFPISRKHVDKYAKVADAVAQIYLEHGALDYFEYIGDDMTREGTRSFPDLVESQNDEVVVFGWVVFGSREARDRVNEKVKSDPRMVDLIAPLIDPSAPVFDPERMAYGGFQPLVKTSNSNN
jgi:uncharacterized protein YbaA (DUF1428 family)